jgi:hypothetical protein
MAVFGSLDTWIGTGYWVASYWGGAVGATGGALVVGALGRLRTRIEAKHAILFALGAAILAITRPYEGLLLTGSAVAGMLVTAKRKSTSARLLLRKGVLPAAVIVSVTAGMMSYYCWRTTGNPVRLPYQENLRQYIPRRMFLWGESQPKTYRHAAMAKIYEALMRRDLSYRRKVQIAAKRITMFYFGPAMLIGTLIGLPAIFQPRIRLLLVCCAIVLAGLACLEYVHPHYASPIACALIGLSVQCLRGMRIKRWRGLPVGQVGVLCVLLTSFSLAAAEGWANRGWHHAGWSVEREKIQNQVVRSGGKHVIFLRYSERHNPNQEWVYNAADLDRAPVIWAREMQDNKPLLEYYKERRAWLLEPDLVPPRLRPYPR